ncbi:BTAD domain-containing putative transcriptional regulator [Micromonospora sp. BQ11]|uniref:BTAD domain-containing putative transcriptional regulator n=1 Tax=Micromonospora sp. BQ11 TaxID=3452212 RepID=UPI003F8BE5E0
MTTRLEILGSLRLVRSRETVAVGGARQRAVLGYLALHSAGPVSAERLIETVWPDTAPARARHSLHQRVHELRRRLTGASALEDGTCGIDVCWEPATGGYRLIIAPDLLDACQFRELVSLARGQAGRGAVEQAVTTMRRATELWRGPVLDGVPALRDLPNAVRLEAERRSAEELRWEWQLRLGRHREVVAEIEVAAAADPLRERTAGLLLLALRACGRDAEALTYYARLRANVRRELGAEPGEWVRAIHQSILENKTLPGHVGTSPALTPLWIQRTRDFVGRHGELALLQQVAGRVFQSRVAHLVTVFGEPGIGKSRLVGELLTTPALEGVTVWTARCRPEPSAGAFSPLTEMLAAQAGVRVTDSTERAVGAVGRHLGPGLPGTSRMLAAALGISGQHDGVDTIDASHAWEQVLRARTQQPLALVVEDIQWALPAFLDFLANVIFTLGDRPLLVVCTSRLDLITTRPTWTAGGTDGTALALAPLDLDACRELVSRLLPAAPEQTVSDIAKRAGGNPLFCEQLVRSTGAHHAGADGALAEPTPMPTRLEAVIRDRWATLPPADVTVLRAAAIIGDTAWTSAIQAVADAIGAADQPPPEVTAATRRLCRLGFLRRAADSRIDDEAEFTFTHGALRTVGYQEIDGSCKALGHRRAAEWWEALPNRGATTIDAVAHHYEQAIVAPGGRMDDPFRARALAAIRAAGSFALARGDYSTAVGRLRTALSLATEDDLVRAHVLLNLGEALYHQCVGGIDELRQACDLLLRHGGPEEVAKADLVLGWIAWACGDGQAATAGIRRAVRSAMSSAPSPAAVRVLSVGAALLALAGDQEAAGRAADRAALLHDPQVDPQPSVLNNRAVVRMHGGDPHAIDDLRAGEALAQRHGLPVRFPSRANIITHHWAFGDLTAASRSFAEAAALPSHRLTDTERTWLRTVGLVHRFWSGDLHDREPELASFVPGGHQLDSDVLRVRALLHARYGRHREALRDAEAAVDVAERSGAVLKIFSAHCCRWSLEPRPTVAVVRELLRLPRPRIHPAETGVLLASILAAAGEPQALARFDFAPTLWLRAAQAFVDNQRIRARTHYVAIGSVPDAHAATAPDPD